MNKAIDPGKMHRQNSNVVDNQALLKFHRSMQTKFLDNTKCMIQFQFLANALKQLRNQ